MAYIYLITNKINGKQYVGKTNSSIEKRFQEHCRDSRKRILEKRPLYLAMNKYGIENFSISLLEECDAKNAIYREVYWIGKLDTYINGYNATIGGDGTAYYNYEELAKAYIELKSLKEVASKFNCDTHTVSIACKEYNIKVLQSKDLQKINYGKRVAMLDKKTNDILLEFSTISDAATYMINNKLTNCKFSTIRTHISEVCRNKRKSAAGYKWIFI